MLISCFLCFFFGGGVDFFMVLHYRSSHFLKLTAGTDLLQLVTMTSWRLYFCFTIVFAPTILFWTPDLIFIFVSFAQLNKLCLRWRPAFVDQSVWNANKVGKEFGKFISIDYLKCILQKLCLPFLTFHNSSTLLNLPTPLTVIRAILLGGEGGVVIDNIGLILDMKMIVCWGERRPKKKRSSGNGKQYACEWACRTRCLWSANNSTQVKMGTWPFGSFVLSKTKL